MKLKSLLLGCVVSVWTIEAQAQPPGPPPGDRPRHNPIVEALDSNGDGEVTFEEISRTMATLKERDANGDEKLTGEELRGVFAAPPRRGGPRDGQGDRGQGDRGPRDRNRGDRDDDRSMTDRLLGFDKNNDGKLAADEVPERMQRLIKAADTNEDGMADKAELEAFASQRRPEGDSEGRARRGRDGDRPEGKARGRGPRERGPGSLGGPEGPGRPDGPGGFRGFRGPGGPPSPERMVEHAFEFDANNDGQLSREEMGAFANEIGKLRRGPGDGPGRGRDEDRPDRPGRPGRPERE